MRRTHRRRAASLSVAVVVVVAGLALGGSGTGRAVGPISYVALGDSYTAGPLIPNQQPDPLGCLRSDHNYPHLVARALQVPRSATRAAPEPRRRT